MMKKLFLLLILTITFTMSTIAQDKITDIKYLLKLVNSEQVSDAMINSMIPVLKQQASEKIQENSAKEKFNSLMDTLIIEVKELSNKLVNVELVNIYEKYFTHEEIKDLIKFYKSPTGKKLLEKSPEITKELINSMMTKHMPEFQENLHKKLQELKEND